MAEFTSSPQQSPVAASSSSSWSSDSFERRIESIGCIITKNTPEFWEERNKAVMELIALVTQCEGFSMTRVHELFSACVFRALRDPIKSMISDLRSQQVRDTCLLLIKLSIVCGDHLRLLLREVFPTILDSLKVQNKVMSGYVDDCICSMIKNVTFKHCLPLIVNEIKECKAKLVRERCIVSLPFFQKCLPLPLFVSYYPLLNEYFQKILKLHTNLCYYNHTRHFLFSFLSTPVLENLQEYLNGILDFWDINDKDAEMIQDAIRAGLEDASVRGREVARFAYLNLRIKFPKRAEFLKNQLPISLQNRLIKLESSNFQIDQSIGDDEIGSKALSVRRMSHVDEAVTSIQALM